MKHPPEPPKISIIYLILTVITIAAVILFIIAMLTGCDKNCLSPEQEANNRKYYEAQSLTKYLLTEDAAQKIFLVSSSDNPSNTDTIGFIKNFTFQHLTGDGSTYKTTDKFTFDSSSKSITIWYYGGYQFVDTTTGKFVRTYKGIDSTQVEFNTRWDWGGSAVFGIYIGKEYKEINMSRVTPKVVVYNPQKSANFKALANAYNVYLGRNYEGGMDLFYSYK